MKKGDIVLLPFPFTDLKGEKLRPALILFSNNLDVTVSFITSETKWKEEFDIELIPTVENGLKIKSLIRITKIATLDKELILGKLGELTPRELKILNQNLALILKL